MKKFRVCSLFSGAGGIDYAFQQAGCEIVWANENDQAACATYRLNFPKTVLAEKDIRKVDVSEIPAFDILTGGFPCQPFSEVGQEKGFDDVRGNLFFEIIRIIDAKKPSVIFLENVASLEQHDQGKTFAVIRTMLESRNYSFHYLVADAQEYGVPQRRNRIYIICFRDQKNSDAFAFPPKTELKKHIFDIIDKSVRAPEWTYLDSQSDTYHKMAKAITDENQVYRFSDGKYGTKSGILSGRNGVSFTLLAGMGNWHDREPIIKDVFGIRKLTPMECFRLQGYPEEFSLKGIAIRDAYRQAGNTVCVPVVRQFAENIVQALNINEPSGTAVNDTIIGLLSSQQQLQTALKYKFYHFPARYLPDTMDNIKYVALYQSEKLFPGNAGIRYIGEIDSFKTQPRNEISELPKSSNELYCRLNISRWERLPSSVSFRFSKNITVTSRFWEDTAK